MLKKRVRRNQKNQSSMKYQFEVYVPVKIHKIVTVGIKARGEKEAEKKISKILQKREFKPDEVLSCRYDVEREENDLKQKCFAFCTDII